MDDDVDSDIDDCEQDDEDNNCGLEDDEVYPNDNIIEIAYINSSLVRNNILRNNILRVDVLCKLL